MKEFTEIKKMLGKPGEGKEEKSKYKKEGKEERRVHHPQTMTQSQMKIRILK
jgi:hypothetical protein